MRPGCYHLVIRLRRATELSVGRFGDWRLPAGWYVYTGSARRGLEARIARHLRGEKRLHWHVDYLLASPYARVVEAVRHRGGSFGECELNQAMEHLPGAQVPVPGFGASDATLRSAAKHELQSRLPSASVLLQATPSATTGNSSCLTGLICEATR